MQDELKDFLLYHRAWEAVHGETATYRANMKDACIHRASWLASGDFKETVKLFQTAMNYTRSNAKGHPNA